MNEHGLRTFKKGVKGKKIAQKFHNSKDIFDFLNIKWVEPSDRETAANFKVLSKSLPLPRAEPIFPQVPQSYTPSYDRARQVVRAQCGCPAAPNQMS